MPLELRPAAATDLPFVLALTRDLAAVEGRPEAVTASEADLARLLFGPRPMGRCFVLVERDGQQAKRIGHAWVSAVVSTFAGTVRLYIDDIVIAPEFRGRGFGREAMALLAGLAVREGFMGMEWSAVEANEGALRFYDRLGAQRTSGTVRYRLDETATRRCAASAISPR